LIEELKLQQVSEFDHPVHQDGKFKGVIDNPTPLNVYLYVAKDINQYIFSEMNKRRNQRYEERKLPKPLDILVKGRPRTVEDDEKYEKNRLKCLNRFKDDFTHDKFKRFQSDLFGTCLAKYPTLKDYFKCQSSIN
jgi:hypothetical protein